MSEFKPVCTKTDLDTLDDDDIVAGYLSVFHGCVDDPGSDKSRGFWHGWRNAMTDRGLATVDAHQSALCSEIVGPSRRAAMM